MARRLQELVARRIHDRALVIVCKGAVDLGSGVSEYIIYALRATTKGSSAPADSEANFSASVEIGRLANLDGIISYRSGGSSEIRDYDPLNEYYFNWYGWEEGYAYRVWTFAMDQAGNVENWDGTGNTNATSVLRDPLDHPVQPPGVEDPDNDDHDLKDPISKLKLKGISADEGYIDDGGEVAIVVEDFFKGKY